MDVLTSDINHNLLNAYEQEVILKYQIYNGLFLGLPFADPDQAGARLPIFTKMCTDWLNEGYSAPEAVAKYLSVVPIPEYHKLSLLFKFLQFVERQVVLFDALEDSAFSKINDISGYGTLDHLINQLNSDKNKYLSQFNVLLEDYKTRVVLTAHPTQFYPTLILGIINRLRKAIEISDINEIRNLFLQLGLTKFSNKCKPTPIDEADSIIWYLENIFYQLLPLIQNKLSTQTTNLELGFWPGGDRDGNPFVTAEITLAVAAKLRKSILNLYSHDIHKLRLRLTFDKVYDYLGEVANKLNQNQYLNAESLIDELIQVISTIKNDYQGLFIDQVNELVLKVKLFRFYFAKLDIRQNSAIHRQAITFLFNDNLVVSSYDSLDDDQKLILIDKNWSNTSLLKSISKNPATAEVINTIRAIWHIQQSNGQDAIERYIISNTDSVASIYEVLWLINLVNLDLATSKPIKVEVVPLFETIDDLANSEKIMHKLFNLPHFMDNIRQMGQHQTIMLGFSDGTKDGGYLMANWAIFKAKKKLSILAKNHGISVTFFDGRGGPPSRGGGDTYAFYYSLAKEIEAHQIQVTIQGQTISANFGTPDAALYNLGHLISAGIGGRLLADKESILSEDQELLINQLAEASYLKYSELRDDPLFVRYLQEITPLDFLSETNIGSRPAKRNDSINLRLQDLRAIPFGAAWMQMRQNILGYYGLGSALADKVAEKEDNLKILQELYRKSLLFKGLIDNSMQSLLTTNFSISCHLGKDPTFGSFWQKLYKEAELTSKMLLDISGYDRLVADNPLKQRSVLFREEIVRPVVYIQQYAIDKFRHISQDDSSYEMLRHIIRKSLATNINASRNSI